MWPAGVAHILSLSHHFSAVPSHAGLPISHLSASMHAGLLGCGCRVGFLNLLQHY